MLDWLEVHELHEVVSGEIAGRQSDDDIVVFKSNGLAAWDVALGAEAVRLARERGVGTALLGQAARPSRPRAMSAAERLDDLRPVEQAALLLGREAVLDVLVLEDLVQRPAAVVLADDVPRDVLLCGAPREQERERCS